MTTAGDPDYRALRQIRREGLANAEKLKVSAVEYGGSRLATATGLLALNDEWGDRFYEVPAEAAIDASAAAEAFEAPGPLVD